MKQLDPKSVWLFFFNSLSGILLIPVVFIGMGLGVFGAILSENSEIIKSTDDGGSFYPIVLSYLWVAILVFLILLVISFMWARLSYNFYRYELTNDGFRKELGVIYKKYVTIPYDRIQNVDIYRGILARILGLSDLNIQTAGMSAGALSGRSLLSGGAAEGRLPGLSQADAEKLRDELIRRAKKNKSQGL